MKTDYTSYASHTLKNNMQTGLRQQNGKTSRHNECLHDYVKHMLVITKQKIMGEGQANDSTPTMQFKPEPDC